MQNLNLAECLPVKQHATRIERAHNFASSIYFVCIQKPSEANTRFFCCFHGALYICAREKPPVRTNSDYHKIL